MRLHLILTLCTFLIVSLNSCKKGEGVGGKATIKGKVYVKEYNSTGTAIIGEHYGAKEDVYIIYGDNDFYDDDIETHYDGSYKFEYLRPGKYTIYVYSEDVSGSAQNPDIVVSKEITITEKDQTIEVEDLVIEKN